MKHLDIAQRLEQSVISIIKGHEKNIRNILACMISGGHVLLEDNPGPARQPSPKQLPKQLMALISAAFNSPPIYCPLTF